MTRFLRGVLARFQADDGFRLAASLAYTTILSVVPVVAVALAIFTAFPGFDAFTAAIQKFFATHLLPQVVADKVMANIDAFARNAGKLTAVGVLAIAATALILVRTIERAFNQIFRVRRERPLLMRLVIYWAFITLGPIVIGVSLVAASYAVSRVLGFAASLPTERLLAVVPWLLVAASLSVLYAVLPNRPVRWRHALAGGVAAASLFELVVRAFAFYVAGAATAYTTVYGALATVPIFLVWIYVSWVVVILGAEITASLPDYAHLPLHGGARTEPQSFRPVLAILRALVRAQSAARPISTVALARAAGVEAAQAETILERLARAGWAGRLAGERWTLTCDARQVTVGAIYVSLVAFGGDAREPADPRVERAMGDLQRAVLRVATPIAALDDAPEASVQPTELNATT